LRLLFYRARCTRAATAYCAYHALPLLLQRHRCAALGIFWAVRTSGTLFDVTRRRRLRCGARDISTRLRESSGIFRLRGGTVLRGAAHLR